MDPSLVKPFLPYWIKERESIRIKKEGRLLPPWTSDPAMANVRYCNVRREDDKVTKWMAEHWRPNHHTVWEITLARMLNYIPTLEDLLLKTHGDLNSLERVGEILKDRRNDKSKVFTSAYTISTCGESMDKVDYVMRVVGAVKSRYGSNPMIWDGVTLADAHKSMTRVMGLGSFLAAQVIADLKNTQSHPLYVAPDWWDWAAPGPGSLRGLSWYFLGAPEGVTASSFDSQIKKCYAEVAPQIPDIPRIHMQDFQNCLCEFSKFMRVKYGSGRVRNNYRPG